MICHSMFSSTVGEKSVSSGLDCKLLLAPRLLTEYSTLYSSEDTAQATLGTQAAPAPATGHLYRGRWSTCCGIIVVLAMLGCSGCSCSWHWPLVPANTLGFQLSAPWQMPWNYSTYHGRCNVTMLHAMAPFYIRYSIYCITFIVTIISIIGEFH